MMKRYFRTSIIFFVGIFLNSCGGMKSIAVGSTASILYDGSFELETENNWHNFRRALPANLKFIEGLLHLDPNNEELLVSAIKGYSSLAFVINETQYLYDQLADNERKGHLQEALFNYTRAFQYAEKFFKLYGIHYPDFIKAGRLENGIVDLLNNKLKAHHMQLEGVLFAAQALASMINLQKDQMAMVGQLPIAKHLFDWVCEKRPKINYGACDLFYGAYYAGRPKTLGGNPAKGKNIFLNMIKKYPNNWLARSLYIQYYLIPFGDEAGYKEQRFYLERFSHEHHKERIWTPLAPKKKDAKLFDQKNMRIYQTLAIERYKAFQKHQKDLF